ncbi:hypothetical protein ACFWHD_34700, partial [Streptomyces sp. NPDC060275]
MGVVIGVVRYGAVGEDTGRGEGASEGGGEAMKGGVAAKGGVAVLAAVGAAGATARCTGAVVPGPVADEVVSTGGRGVRGVTEWRAGRGDGGVGAAAAAGGTAGRTASAGPDEVGAPSPGRRAAALRCTGWAGAPGGGLVAGRPVPGGESGTAGLGPGVVRAGTTGLLADRCTVGAAGASWCGPGTGPVADPPGTSADRFAARWTGAVGPAASEGRWADGE